MFFHPNHIHPGMQHNNFPSDKSSDGNTDNFVVTIMAAGEGKRMNSNVPKVLHPFKGVPMLVRIIKTVEKTSPKKIIVVTGKFHDLILNVLSKHIDINHITFIKQNEPLGTADAIKSCLKEYHSNDYVLILNGDMPCIHENTIVQFVNNCDEAGLITAKIDNPSGYGRIISDKKNNFIEIKEHKDCNEEEIKIDEINVGIYYFQAMILKTYIPKINNNNKQNEFYLTDIIKKIRECEDLDIYKFLIQQNDNFQVMGVNTPDELKHLENISKF